MNKSKYVWGGIVLIALVFAGFLWHQSLKAKKNNSASKVEGKKVADVEQSGNVDDIQDSQLLDEEGEAFGDQDFNAICESGEWTKITEETAGLTTVSGKLRKVYPDDEASKPFKDFVFFLQGTQSVGLTAEKPVTLDFFEDREVEIQGVKDAAKNAIAVAQIRCAGQETNKDLIGERKKLMDFIAANINNIAPQKAKHQKWTADIVDFVDEKNVYVEYYDTVEDDENSDIDEDTAKRVLLETSAKAGGGYDAKVLAYWEMGEDDFVLKTGTDKFENVEDVTSYQYDPETKIWERID